MKVLMIFELKKFLTHKLNYLIFGILILTFVGFIYPKTVEDRISWMNLPHFINSALEANIQTVPVWKEELKNYPGNANLVAILEDSDITIEAQTKMLEAIETNDWNKYLTFKIQNDKTDLAATKAGRLSGPNIYDLQDEIELNELLLAQNIKPIFTDSSLQSVNFLILFLQSHLPLVLLLSVILMSSHFVSHDFEKDTYKLLYTQPISKFKILLSKFMAALIINLSFIFGLLGSCCVILGAIYGIGDLQYPTKLYEQGELAYRTAGHYVGVGLVIFLFLILLCILVTFLFSTLSHHTLVTLICSGFILCCPLLLNEQSDSRLMRYFPFIFSEIGAVLSGTYLIKEIDFNQGLVILPMSLIIAAILLVTVFKVRKLA